MYQIIIIGNLKFNLQILALKLQKLQQPLINIGKKSQKQILREDLQKYHTAYLFSYKDVRKYVLNNVVDFAQWRGSKLWFGKNKIIHGALQNLSLFNIYWPDVEKVIIAD